MDIKIDKKNKNISIFYHKINLLISHIDNLLNNKFIKKEFYFKNIQLLDDTYKKIKNYELLIEKNGIN